MSYSDVYQARLNRFGSDYQERVANQRAKSFDNYRAQSVYKTSFNFGTKIVYGVLEPNKQDLSKTTSYLLLALNDQIAVGSVVTIENQKWLLCSLENKVNKGYLSYTVIQISHSISWKDHSGVNHTSDCYISGSASKAIQDLRISGKNSPVAREPSKGIVAILPYNEYLHKDDYVIIDNENEAYLITDYDKLSSKNIIYLSLNQTIIHDTSPMPKLDLTKDDSFWLNGGAQ